LPQRAHRIHLNQKSLIKVVLAATASLAAAAREGALAVPPGAAVDSAPAAQPSAAA
jgi:hypothetical protein